MSRVVWLVLLLLSACSYGPDEAQLQQDVAQRLSEALAPDIVGVGALERRGTQRDLSAPAGEKRRIIYFDAQLRLARDYDFGAWDSPGVAGVISALGTGPKGLTGIVNGGNKSGDVIEAHGTAIYKLEGERWQPVAPKGFRDAVAPAYATGGPTSAPEGFIAAMRDVMADASPDMSETTRAVVAEELQSAYTAAQARLARIQHGYAVAAGPRGGQYLRLAQALSNPAMHVVSLLTAGGEENLRLVREGRASLGFVQGDSALAAYAGKEPYAREAPHTSMHAIGSLYPEPVHVLVRADSDIATMAQLTKRRVGVGVSGAASRTTALDVLQAHGLSANDFVAVESPLNEALVALSRKEIDALIQVIGFPADNIRSAMAVVPLRLLPLDAQAIHTLAADNPARFPLTLPPGTYPRQSGPVPTIGTAAVMIVSDALTDTEVAQFTRLLYAGGEDLVARGSAQGAKLSAANARMGLAIPMHTAAAKALEELQAATKGR